MPTTRKNSSGISSKKITSQSIPLNSKILEILDIFLRFYTAKNDKIHILAYNKAIHGIKSVAREIKSLADADHIPGIGKGMLEKISIILETGTHPKVDEMLAFIGATSSELNQLMGFGSTLIDRKSTRLNSSHEWISRMPSSA